MISMFIPGFPLDSYFDLSFSYDGQSYYTRYLLRSSCCAKMLPLWFSMPSMLHQQGGLRKATDGRKHGTPYPGERGSAKNYTF